MYHHLP